MELQKHQSQQIQLSESIESLQKKDCYKNLPILEKEIAIACLSPRIKELNENSFKSEMIKLIGQTHLNCGFKLDESQLMQTIDELCSDLLKYNSTLSFQEIEIAFKNGYKKKYGEFFGLSNATYFGWVNAYCWGESRAKAKKAIEDSKKEPSKEELTDDEKEKIIVDGVLEAFENFKKGAIVLDAGNVKYNFLDKKKLIPFTAERKEIIKKKAIENIKNNVLLENKKSNKPLEKSLNEALNENSVKSECKRIALFEYFKECVEMDVELSELLSKK